MMLRSTPSKPLRTRRGPRSVRSTRLAATVAHLTSVHYYWDHRIFAKECRTLAEAGFRVTLVAPKEADAMIDGVEIRAVPIPSNRKQRLTRTVWHVYRAAVRVNADLYHFHDPELILVGFLLKLRGKRVIYDVHEDMSRTVLRKSWLPAPLLPIIARLIGILELAAVRMLDATVLVIPMPGRGFPTRKCVLVRNFPVAREFVSASRPYQERPPLAVYVGGIGVGRGAKDMIEAIGLVPSALGARLAMAGWFQPAKLERELRAMPSFERVDILGNRTRDEIVLLLNEARVGLCVLHAVPGYPESYPVKLFEYMAAGIPVIASDFPVWRAIVQAADCGVLIQPGQPSALADALAFLLEHKEEAQAMGERGRHAMAAKYTWDREGARLVALYDRLLVQRSMRR